MTIEELKKQGIKFLKPIFWNIPNRFLEIDNNKWFLHENYSRNQLVMDDEDEVIQFTKRSDFVAYNTALSI